MLSIIASVCLIFIVLLDQFNYGMIIGECQQPNEWKSWLNVNRPTALGLSFDQKNLNHLLFDNFPWIFAGEFEIVPHYQKLFAGQPFVCANPTGLEVKTADDREPAATGDTFRFTLKEGFYCLNQIIKPKKKKCTDYKLKFCCPAWCNRSTPLYLHLQINTSFSFLLIESITDHTK